MKNNWIEQLFVPPLQYGILMQSYDEDTHEIHEQICKDPEKCGSKILLSRDEGHMYDRLPSPVRDSPEPAYSSLIKDGQWKMGIQTDISQNPEIMNKLNTLNEGLDELRKNLNDPKCSCDDIDKNTFAPDHCKGANLSSQFKWSDRYTHKEADSTDTDIRHNIICDNNYDYKSQLNGKNLVYNCSRNRWETIGDSRSDKFQVYTFPQGTIHCSDSKSDPEKVDEEGFTTRFQRQRQIKPFHIALFLIAIFLATPAGGLFVYRGSKEKSDVVIWVIFALASIAIYAILKFY